METKNTKLEYLPMVMQRYNEEKGQWFNARVIAENHIDSPWKPSGKRVCESKEEAIEYIAWLQKHYKASDTPKEITRKVGMVGISHIENVDFQKSQEVIKWKVKVREVTEYEVIAQWEE